MKKSYPVNKSVLIAKMKAALLHFVCSVIIFLLALAWIRWVLYPDFHFALNGVLYGLRLIAGVDLVLGPLLTLLVFHTMKPMREKITDFVVVGVVQLAALVYGLQTMYQEHPRMLMFNTYGTAVTVTQREFGEKPKTELPENLAQFGKLAGVPVATLARENEQFVYREVSDADIQAADKETRRTMNYDDDKAALATIEQQHGKVKVFAVLGKYQGVFVALDSKRNIVATFGQRDLQ